MENMSQEAQFQGWWDGGDKKQITTIENGHARSISRVVTKNNQPHCQKRACVLNLDSVGVVVGWW